MNTQFKLDAAPNFDWNLNILHRITIWPQKKLNLFGPLFINGFIHNSLNQSQAFFLGYGTLWYNLKRDSLTCSQIIIIVWPHFNYFRNSSGHNCSTIPSFLLRYGTLWYIFKDIHSLIVKLLSGHNDNACFWSLFCPLYLKGLYHKSTPAFILCYRPCSTIS